jgi:hypothetical protein
MSVFNAINSKQSIIMICSDSYGSNGGVYPAAHFLTSFATEYPKIMIDIQ